MARPRKPKALKLLHGTDQPCRSRVEADFPPVESAEPPHWVLEGEATREWYIRVEQLTLAGVLTSADLTMLGVYCNMHHCAVRKWNDGGDPSSADLTQLRMMAHEFGFTPATRSKAEKAREPGKKNPFAQFDRN